MRLGLVVPGGVDRSGTERVIPCLLWLIEGLARRGHDVHVFALHQEPHPARWDLLGATIQNVGGRFAGLGAVVAIRAEHRRLPFDMLHGVFAHSGGIAAAIAGRLTRVPSILTLAGGELAAISDIGYGGRLTLRGRLVGGLAFRLASGITAPSEYLCAQARALGVTAVPIPFGIALDRWKPRLPQPRNPRAPFRLLHVASLNRVKDQAMLLRAASALSAREVAFALTLVGEDTLDNEVQRMAEDMGLSESVSFAGFVPQPTLRPWFENADLLVVTSRHEAGPIAFLEAAAMGVPTVGTAVGHIADLSPGAAVAVPVGDHVELARAIEAMGQNEAARLAIAHEAQAFATRFDMEATITEFERLYEEAREASG